MPQTLITVCTANICRSPMAEGLLREKLKGQAIRIDSAGVEARYFAGEPPDARAIHVLRQHGIDISDLRARQLTREDMQSDSTWILVATEKHRYMAELLKTRADGQARIMKLLDYHPDAALRGCDLRDPYGGDIQDFERTYQELDEALTAFVAALSIHH